MRCCQYNSERNILHDMIAYMSKDGDGAWKGFYGLVRKTAARLSICLRDTGLNCKI